METSAVNSSPRKPPVASRLVEFRKTVAQHVARPLVRLLAKTAVTPNTLTWFGFMLSLGAAVLIGTGHLFAAGFLVLFAGLFDILDGALARHKSKVTSFGGILDSTLDRVTEAFLMLAILILYARELSLPGIVMVGIALPGSLLVSYVRARAEAAGLKGETGWFTRAERVIILALGLLLSSFNYALLSALGVIALFSYITVIQRMVHAWRQTRNV
jgi:CDP-diacylglycerol--glycerol-3-phosphate 3-phosphatidyltransferase